ncbi:uncharacterized protein LOC142162273 [Nicotiana tabacum]|uniref:Uncharacterized protein LOC142162273 n=1 Tax=Nicotiana tabacum TaxID=4097 RepID=A0AC58RPQ7_TOBAC
MEATTNNTLLENLSHNHPLFLHSTDNFGAILISLQLTGSKNYSIWSRAMCIAILGRNKMGFIEGTCKKESYGPNMTDLWESCSAIVLSWIMNCVSKDLLSGVIYSSDACAVWRYLKERFDKVNGSIIFQLHKAIATVNQGTSSIASYYSKLRELWAEYDSLTPIPRCECPKSRDYVTFMRRQKLLQFLMGLNETYEQAREHIMMMELLPIVNKACSMLVEREIQRSIAHMTIGGDKAE